MSPRAFGKLVDAVVTFFGAADDERTVSGIRLDERALLCTTGFATGSGCGLRLVILSSLNFI